MLIEVNGLNIGIFFYINYYSQCRGELSTVKVKNAELKSLLDKAKAELTKKVC